MKSLVTIIRHAAFMASMGWIASTAEPAYAQTSGDIRIVELQGVVEILPQGAANWVLTQTNQPLYAQDRVRTRTNSSVGLLMSDRSVLRFDAMSEMEILPADGSDRPGLHLIHGILSFFHRDKPGRIRVIAGGALAGIEGTEFVMATGGTNSSEKTTLSVIDGKVRFENAATALLLTNGEEAVAMPGAAPRRTAGFNANNLLKWCFYYPGVLNLEELPLTAGEKTALAESLTAYRAGDLPAALAKYPAARQPDSDAERIYFAALLLSVGQAGPAEAGLTTLTETEPGARNQRLAAALRTLIAAVKRDQKNAPKARPVNDQLSSEQLAGSYYEQSLGGPEGLKLALELARRAATNSPDFGFAWERLAELEFSFGWIDRARADLNHALQLSPRNAQALALNGFLLAAQNRTREAIASFNDALAVDSALGNAWLGRGLCRIRRGDTQGGREDLLIAAAMEPQRASLRSYLGKALGDAGDTRRASHELELAKQLDKNDPTAWLYSALLAEQNNRVNGAISDLEHAQALNDNRSVYRSSLLLDEDRAVRSANLARIYDEAGMPDVAYREAVRAVNSDYGNYSAHLFLANSYAQLADPNLVNLRYEPAQTTEYLLANLLAPVGAGTLSPTISQDEYSKLFEGDGFHLTASTEYLSRGAWTASAAQYGTFGDTSYSLEGNYRTDPGERVNNDIEEHTESISIKQQFTPHDSLYLQAYWFNTEGGDLAQLYDQNAADPLFRSKESQDGSLILGYHHTWQPGVDTLVLAARVPDTTSFSDPLSQTLAFDPVASQAVPISLINQYQADLTMYLMELQQLIRHNDEHETIFGAKYAYGGLDVANTETVPNGSLLPFLGFPPAGSPVSSENFSESIQRFDIYLYHRWEVISRLWLQGGVSYDWVLMPENFLYAPLTDQMTTRNQISPKAGLVWNPLKDTTVRAAYTRSLSGASFEQSLSLEPAQVAGFTQTYRDVVPAAVVGGPTPAAPVDNYGVALEQKFKTGTYLGLSCQLIKSAFDQGVGGYGLNFDPITSTYSVQGPAVAREHLDYTEKSLMFTANQLLGRDFSVGVKYQVTDSKLSEQLTGVISPPAPLANSRTTMSSLLQQTDFSVTWNHPSGIFAQGDALWSVQSNDGFSPAEPGDNFWQLNILVGYHFPRRQAQISIGVLNLTDTDYKLEPLNFYNELPHSRTLVVQGSFSF